ncbi:hypothetical protein [Mycobacterium sp. ITM-2016-00318]|uniref:hypothetical protein n=1 Tax=Mycobacterium sp. ITM-2016-00318 TaxID=2099693 RepID=UPI001E508CC5|nr:hypothetical protein [Mycobacterium sp. ITM-2016-00318]WNG94476.1 hypothetical protein C6A82_008615 [Mycobacterium sp. ITM-2016-00318]
MAPRTVIESASVDDVEVVVRVGLRGWTQRAVSFDIDLCHGERQVFIEAERLEHSPT